MGTNLFWAFYVIAYLFLNQFHGDTVSIQMTVNKLDCERMKNLFLVYHMTTFFFLLVGSDGYMSHLFWAGVGGGGGDWSVIIYPFCIVQY